MIRIAPDHRSHDHSNPTRPNANLTQSEDLEPPTRSLALLKQKLTRTLAFDVAFVKFTFCKKTP